ncbi:uncharacterized protein BDV14DRAFT_192387 [Aspergillus stella-maris]|uniref:uncharacterized protein n=1 Tax=Aspergillus stella-maris TaxID=1810926 RepID=UPI003CCD0D00
MAQPFYPADDDVGFDPQTRRGISSMPHFQSDIQQENIDRSLSCISAGLDAEAKSQGRGQTRRRIPVACQRCRKRKIRCSGDVGDGQGCSNCRSSGNTLCQFLRASEPSRACLLHLLHANGLGSAPVWPYPANEMVSRSYAPSSSRTRSVPCNLSHQRVPSFSRPPDYEVSSITPSPYARQSFSFEPTSNYEPESSVQNAQATPAYVLPSSPQVLLADYSGLHWNPRGWGADLPCTRAPADAIAPEHDTAPSLTLSAYPFVVPSQGQQTNEVHSMVPAQSSVIPPVQGPERENADSNNRDPFFENGSGPVTTADAPPPPNEYSRPPHYWVSRYESQTSRSPISQMAFETAAMGRRMIPSSRSDMTFSYLPVASSGAPSTMMSSSESYAGLDSTTPVAEAATEFRGDTSAQYRSFLRSTRRMTPFTDPRPGTYGYSRPAYRNRPETDSSSDNTLVSGLQYTRPTAPAILPEMDEKPNLATLIDTPTYPGLCSQ